MRPICTAKKISGLASAMFGRRVMSGSFLGPEGVGLLFARARRHGSGEPESRGFENRPIVHYPQAYSLDAIRHDIEDRYDILLMIANPSGAFGLTGIDQFCRKRRGRNQIK
jgi:hypothetical protein